MAMPSSPDEEKWRAEEDLRTLRRADEIKKDQDRLSKARQLAKDELGALRKVSREDDNESDGGDLGRGYRRLG